jgi:alpha-tubulin suppressor-like RCC1 family protein
MGRVEKIYKLELNDFLNDKYIIDIYCSECDKIALTNKGEVYAWGHYYWGQISNGCNDNQLIPVKVNDFDGQKVFMIICGLMHSMLLTESGRVFSWGPNNCGQLGHNNTKDLNKPSIITFFEEMTIKKINCGRLYSLFLSRDGCVYWFGDNGCETQIILKKLTIKENEFTDISTHYYYNILLNLENL